MDKVEDINALTHRVIGCAMTVHNILGNGFQPGRRSGSGVPKSVSD